MQGSVYNPFRERELRHRAVWEVHAEVISQLLVGCVNRRELVGVLLDGISTPPGCSLDDTVRTMTNRRLKATAIVSAACLDSRSNDLLQVADLAAGSILQSDDEQVGVIRRGTTRDAWRCGSRTRSTDQDSPTAARDGSTSRRSVGVRGPRPSTVRRVQVEAARLEPAIMTGGVAGASGS